MKIKIISCLQDNYSYILIDDKTNIACVIDPSESKPIINYIEKKKLKLKFILNTHHHYDHVGGNKELKKRYDSKVVGFNNDKDRIPEIDILVQHNQIWNGEKTTGQNRHELINGLKKSLGQNARMFNFNTGSDARSVFSYHMHTLPEEISTNIGTSTLFAAWNAAIYAAQIEDEKLESVISNDEYLKITERVLKKYGGLWFNDESFIVSRKRS